MSHCTHAHYQTQLPYWGYGYTTSHTVTVFRTIYRANSRKQETDTPHKPQQYYLTSIISIVPTDTNPDRASNGHGMTCTFHTVTR